MPELPEVETIRRGLEQSIKGRTIDEVAIRRPDLRIPLPENFSKTLVRRTITHLHRRGKYLLIELDNTLIWIVHLGMSGKIIVHENAPAKYEKHDHVITLFNDSSCLVFNDARRFGLMTLCQKPEIDNHPLLAKLGPEPLSNQFNEDILYDKLENKHTSIKAALMDSHIIAGLGNIYVCESLFRSGISPLNKAHALSRNKVSALTNEIPVVLKEAIASGGSTLRDYVRSSGDLGYFQHKFQVYGRENEPCAKCGEPIKRIIQQNRSTFYCPHCQT